MKQISIEKDSKVLGTIYEKESNLFLIGNKGVKITELYIEIFKKLGKSVSLGSTIGAIEDIRIGYRNNETQKYEITEIKESHEIVNLSGNIGLKPNGIVFPHLHVSVSNDNCQVFGGHLVDATISITLESHLILLPMVLQRSHDKTTGLDLITSVS